MSVVRQALPLHIQGLNKIIGTPIVLGVDIICVGYCENKINVAVIFC